MTTSTKAPVEAPKPATPKPQAPGKANSAKPAATPKQMDNVPETDVAPKPAARTGNALYADEDTRAKITQAMQDLRDKGFTRPSISAVTGFTDSQVWRAQNNKVHTSEVPAILDFIQQVVDGKVKPPENSQRKPKVADLEAKIQTALSAVAELDPKATVTALRKAVADVKAALEA